MSYYRPPVDLSGTAGVAEPTVASEPIAPPAAPAPADVPVAPTPSVTPIAAVVAGAEADEARRKRKRLIIGLCAAVDIVIVAIVLAVVLS